MSSVGECLTRISRDLNEPDNTFPLGSWSRTEMIDYLNRAESEWVHLTGMFAQDVTITLPPGQGILIERPNGINDITRISFSGKPLNRQTAELFELEDRNWRNHTTGQPSKWHEDRLPWQYIELNRIPQDGGTMRFFGDKRFDPYTDDDNQQMHVNDYWEMYLRWRVLSLALIKESDDRDATRGKYAQGRFMIGVRLARYLMRGVEDAKL